MRKRDTEAFQALSELNEAYQHPKKPPAESHVGWEDYEAFREAMRRPVKAADAAGAALIAKALGTAIRGDKLN